MFDTLIGKIVGYWVAEGIVPEDDRDIYEYGLESVLFPLVNTAAIIATAVPVGMLPESLVLIAALIPLQCLGGGYHATTHLRCFLITYMNWLAAMLALPYISMIAENTSPSSAQAAIPSSVATSITRFPSQSAVRLLLRRATRGQAVRRFRFAFPFHGVFRGNGKCQGTIVCVPPRALKCGVATSSGTEYCRGIRREWYNLACPLSDDGSLAPRLRSPNSKYAKTRGLSDVLRGPLSPVGQLSVRLQ